MTTLTGTLSLLRFILRMDRTRLTVWIVVLAFLPVMVAATFAGLYDTEAARLELMGTVVSNPGLGAMLGPVYDSSIGALTTWRVGAVGGLLVALMAVLTVIRHTRDEEETGRRELLGSTVIGRHAPLTAALAVTVGAGLTIGVLLAAGLVGAGQPVDGAIAFSLGWVSLALVFATVGAVAAQLTEGSGAARGIAVGAVGTAYLLRLIGDGAESGGFGWLVWSSPIGWFTRLRAFADEQWWVLALPVVLALVTGSAAYRLSSRRDVGAGVFAPRSGPGEAAALLSTPLGLSWRLQRGSLIGWSLGLAVMGGVWGGLANTMVDLLSDNPRLAVIFELLGGERAITDAFFSAAMGILGLLASAYAIRAALRLRLEEEMLRVEPLLATATPRLRWVGSHLVFGAMGPVLIMALAGLVAGLIYGYSIGDITGQVPRLLGAALLHIPAVWVMVGVAMMLFGVVRRLSNVSWGVLVAFLLLGQLGVILQLPQWALNLSPFTHIPQLPGEASAAPLLWLTAVAAGLIGVGLVGFQRRDLT